MSIGDRIKEIREQLKLKQKPFADAIGVSQGNLSEIERGKFTPSVDTIISVNRYSKISTDWILTGEDFYDKSKQGQIMEGHVMYQVDPHYSDLQKLIEAFNLLDNDNRHALKTYAAFLLSQKLPDVLEEALSKTRAPAPDPEPEPIKEEKRVYLPILGTAAAGTPILTEELLEGFLSVPTTKIKKNSFLIRVKGESMIEANINSGDLVIINPQPTVETGEIALVKIDGEVTIKKFHLVDFELRLKPANCSMKDIVVNDLTKIKVLGKVIGVIPAEEANQNMIHEFDEPNE